MMRYDNEQTDAAVARLATITDDDLIGLVDQPAATGLFNDIVSTDRRGDDDAQRADQRNARRRPSARLALGLAGAVAATAGAAVFAGSPPVKAPPAMSPVAFTTTQKGYIVATIIDPYATASSLNASFARQGLRITMKLIPVSPSVVGTFAGGNQDGGDQAAIKPLLNGRCVTGGGVCPIAIKIARNFSGSAAINIGRPARPGEAYAGSADPTAPGEVLHCSGLYGSTIGRMLPVLRAKGLTVSWRTDTVPSGGHPASVPEPSPPASHYIRAAALESSNRIVIWTTQGRSDPAFQTLGGSSQFQAALNKGCGLRKP